MGGEVASKSADISLGGKVIGKISTLTPVEVVSKNGATAKIKVKGVASENYPLQIQKNMQEGEIYAVFDKERSENFAKGKKLEDDGMYEVAADAITSDDKALYAKAKELYEGTCSACHRLHEPNSFTVNQWPANLQGMVDAGYVAQISPQIFIIHAITREQNEQNAVVRTNLENFLLNSKYYAVGRLKNLDENGAKIFVARLEKELGKPFILAPKNEANLYCTTLIERSLKGISNLNLTYQKLSLPIFRGEYLFPEAFWQGGNLQTIFENRR